MEIDNTLKEPVYFDYDGGRLVYSFIYLNICQCELAESFGRFIIDSMESQASDFNTKIKSGSVKWITTLMSYLFCKEGDENLPKEDSYFTEINKIISNTKSGFQYKLLKEVVVKDFFYSIGEGWMVALLLPDKLKQMQNQNMSKILTQLIANTNVNKTNLLNEDSGLKTSAIKPNLKKGK